VGERTDHGHQVRMDHGRGSVLVDGGEQRGRRVGDQRRDATIGVDGGVQRGRRVVDLWQNRAPKYCGCLQ
jgi:hypothetical protein